MAFDCEYSFARCATNFQIFYVNIFLLDWKNIVNIISTFRQYVAPENMKFIDSKNILLTLYLISYFKKVQSLEKLQC